MTTVAIISQKGGAGKTTLALHLAVAAQDAGRVSLIIDTDPQATASQWGSWREDKPPEVIDSPPPRLAAKVEQAQQIILGPLLDFALGQLGNIGSEEGSHSLGAGPGAGVHPEHAMAGYTVEFQLVFLERLAHEMRAREAGTALALEHVVAGLGACRTGFLGKGKKTVESF